MATLIAAGALLSGCGSPAASDEEEEAEYPAAITCSAFYRPVAGQSAGEEREEFTVEREDGPMRSTEDGIAGAVGAEFGELALEVSYTSGAPDGNGVLIIVTDSEGVELTRDLYQMGTPPLAEIEFGGGHGFTGLTYVTHAEAQLQYWCAATAE
ncbi:hypothetical protein F4561_003742 [Lipingzhangella halophila]|uniref:Uncharacterized protein n=1 Tax=Lipingzhangella halophila TaxID=1783352 RepID=A0A7W7W3D3_9ACTN|nr:hypothetical protein [Lipingzhangella halophila]MBB4932922.1 hypothetical protein [Lipingzhangella halophila]